MIDYISALPKARDLPDFPRRLTVLGSTGSIGRSTLKVVRDHAEAFTVQALAAGRNVELLAKQAAKFRPAVLATLLPEGASRLRELLPADYRPEILAGPQAFVDLASDGQTQVVLSAIVGAAGLPPTLAAAKAGKIVALANKESLVLAGGLIRQACRKSGAVILPVDSEHNALFQSLVGHDGADVDHLVLTASGGPLRTLTREEIAKVTPERALKHPNWSMGAKITIDSATLMNKGLEVIEACHLYGLPEDRVRVLVHPQSIVHSLAAYRDGSLLAHLGTPDMRIAIAYCLCYPKRLSLAVEPLNLAKIGTLSFEEPRLAAFPCLDLARRAVRAGTSHCVVLNAANEVAVERFLAGAIPFTAIAQAVTWALESHAGQPADDLTAIMELDKAAREAVAGYLTESA
jgi:1-deoxy-D-xylulose-5-phosphate reductoisomerase